MDPISLIVQALVVGVSTALKDTAGSAVKDAYAGLVSLVRRRLGRAGAPDVDEMEQNPAADTTALATKLQASDAGLDLELVRAAAVLMQHVDPGGARAGRYTVTVTGGKGVVVGNEGTVTMNFNDGD